MGLVELRPFCEAVARVSRIGVSQAARDGFSAVRRAFRRADEKKLDAWLSRHEREVYEALLVHRYVIDIDNTVKPIYEHQEGAELVVMRQNPRQERT